MLPTRGKPYPKKETPQTSLGRSTDARIGGGGGRAEREPLRQFPTRVPVKVCCPAVSVVGSVPNISCPDHWPATRLSTLRSLLVSTGRTAPVILKSLAWPLMSP